MLAESFLILQTGCVGYVICVAAEAVRIEYVFVSLFCQACLFSPPFVSLIPWQVFSFAHVLLSFHLQWNLLVELSFSLFQCCVLKVQRN